MAEQDDAADKSHEPTQKKLDDARKKGEIARSNDVNVALSYFGIWLLLLTVGAFAISNLGVVLQTSLREAANPQRSLVFSSGVFAPILLGAGSFVGLFAAGPACLIVVALVSQRALIFTLSKLMPKLSRISVIKNAGNKFGRGGLFEFAKSFVKLTVYSLCLALFLWANADIVVGASAGTDRGAILVLFDLLISFLSLVVLIAAAIAIIDYGWQVMEHQRKNRMSHKEMRDESKDSEGDPHLKQARRACSGDSAFTDDVGCSHGRCDHSESHALRGCVEVGRITHGSTHLCCQGRRRNCVADPGSGERFQSCDPFRSTDCTRSVCGRRNRARDQAGALCCRGCGDPICRSAKTRKTT